MTGWPEFGVKGVATYRRRDEEVDVTVEYLLGGDYISVEFPDGVRDVDDFEILVDRPLSPTEVWHLVDGAMRDYNFE